MTFRNTYNLVNKFAAFPCAEPHPIIIMVTFIPAVVPALVEWFSFGCRDVMKFRLGKGGMCGRAIRGQWGKVIPPAAVDPIAKTLKFEGLFSRIGQRFLFADLASDTLARWTTLSYQLAKCPDALEGASWRIELGPPGLLSPNQPHPVGGVIRDEKGTPGIAWPVGAHVPAGWYVQLYFEMTVKAFRSDANVGLSTWIRVTPGVTYDFPANHYKKGYWFQTKGGSYTLSTQNTDPHGAQFYTFMAMVDETAWIESLNGYGQAAPYPLTDWSLHPLGCLRDWTIDEVPNPAGINPPTRNPPIIDKWLNPDLHTPAYGPPGGKPRSK